MGSYVSPSNDTVERLRELEARLARLEAHPSSGTSVRLPPRKNTTPPLSSHRPVGVHGALMKELMERRRAIIDPPNEQ